MQAARDGEVDVVVAWDVTQLGAGAHDVLDNLGELESLGVRVVAVAQRLDLWVGGEAMMLLRNLR